MGKLSEAIVANKRVNGGLCGTLRGAFLGKPLNSIPLLDLFTECECRNYFFHHCGYLYA